MLHSLKYMIFSQQMSDIFEFLDQYAHCARKKIFLFSENKNKSFNNDYNNNSNVIPCLMTRLPSDKCQASSPLCDHHRTLHEQR